jgi:serine/threonine protein kinase
MEEALDLDPTADLGNLLPPSSAPRDRLIALHEMIKIELGRRWSGKRPITLEDYLRRYPELGSAATVPVALIYEEYRARQLYGDHPTLESYQKRFPNQYEQLLHKLHAQPEVTFAETNGPFTKELPEAGEAKTAPPQSELVSIPATLAPVVPARPASTSATGSSGKTVVPVVGEYELQQRIGNGQFGEVFKAKAPGGGTVALKRLFRPLDDAATLREQKALDLICQLNHPFLLQTQLYWVNEGRLVIVMELADGSLSDWLNECKAAGHKGIPVQPLLEYFRQAAAALDHLHSQKPAVMHRDIKPANLLRLKGYAKVADFGLVREQDHNLVTATYCGTPAYMPPEMWNSKLHRNSDQYSLAVTYAEMRLGRRCFSANNPRDLAMQHLEGRANLTGLDPAEQQVLHKALSPDPEKRYPSCQAFVQALSDVHRPPPQRERRSWLLTALLTTGLVMALAVIGVLGYKYLRRAPEPPRPDWQPPGWESTADSTLVQDSQGWRYWDVLTKKIGNQEVELLAIRKNNPNDPDTFYILRNKVCNDLFKAVMETEKAKETLQARLAESGLQTEKPEVPGDYIRLGQWKRGARAGGKDLGIDGPQGQLPVLRVTVLEALVFAELLGGRLPSMKQWQKAAGKGEAGESKRNGPFVADPLNPLDFKGIALGLKDTGPRPVGTSKQDVSVHGCRDMAGNGMEWTRTLVVGGEVPVPFQGGRDMPQVFVMGRSYVDTDPWQFSDPDGTSDYNQTRFWFGFRIVVEK